MINFGVQTHIHGVLAPPFVEVLLGLQALRGPIGGHQKRRVRREDRHPRPTTRIEVVDPTLFRQAERREQLLRPGAMYHPELVVLIARPGNVAQVKMLRHALPLSSFVH